MHGILFPWSNLNATQTIVICRIRSLYSFEKYLLRSLVQVAFPKLLKILPEELLIRGHRYKSFWAVVVLGSSRSNIWCDKLLRMAGPHYYFSAMLGNECDCRKVFFLMDEVGSQIQQACFSPPCNRLLAAHASALQNQFPLPLSLLFFPGMFQFMVNYFYFLVTLTLWNN